MGQLSGRSIRTFVLRQGRLTDGQQRSLDLHWNEYGIDVNPDDGICTRPVVTKQVTPAVTDSEPADSSAVIRDASLEADRIDLNQHFETGADVWMEIGIGNGAALVYMAERNPSINFLGVEVHLPGIGHALGEIANTGLGNVRLIRYDVMDLIEHFMMPASVDRVLIYFPDPWHKTRHHKRRLVNEKFLSMLAKLLRPGGLIHFASDWVPYAQQVQSLVAQHPQYEIMPDSEESEAVIRLRPETHFERRGLRLGHKVTDLVIRKKSS